MLPKNVTTRTTIPGVRIHPGEASPSSLVVNNRNLGARGEMSGGLGSQSATSREKMQLRHLMAKTNSELYENNPIAQRRMQQQIASKAGELYGIDPKKLMNGGSQTVTERSSFASNAGSSSNYGMKIPGSSTPAAGSIGNAWNTSATFGLAEKMKVSPLGR